MSRGRNGRHSGAFWLEVSVFPPFPTVGKAIRGAAGCQMGASPPPACLPAVPGLVQYLGLVLSL